MEAVRKPSRSLLESIQESFHYPVARAAAHFYPKLDHELHHYRAMIIRHCRPDGVVLDLGCGHASHLTALGRVYRRLIGVDVTPRIAENVGLDFKVRGDLYEIPLADDSVDLVVSSYLIEHVERPDAAFRQIARVLRPGGKFVFLTPNRRHYVCLVARLTPHWFHRWFLASKHGRSAEDVHRTLYRANTPHRIRELASRNGFRVVELQMFEAAPAYLGWSWPTFLLGVAYERVVNRFEALSGLRVSMMATLERLP